MWMEYSFLLSQRLVCVASHRAGQGGFEVLFAGQPGWITPSTFPDPQRVTLNWFGAGVSKCRKKELCWSQPGLVYLCLFHLLSLSALPRPLHAQEAPGRLHTDLQGGVPLAKKLCRFQSMKQGLTTDDVPRPPILSGFLEVSLWFVCKAGFWVGAPYWSPLQAETGMR